MAVQGAPPEVPFKNTSLPSCLLFPQLDIPPLSSIMSSFLPSIKALSKAALTYSQLALLSTSNTVSGGTPETCSNPQTSCQNTSAVANTCCFNAPGGQLLQVRQVAHNLCAPIPAYCVPTDSVLGRRPFYRTSQFLDYPRPVVSQQLSPMLSF